MASSSSSSHFVPASDSPSRTYDVFLSFRGKDTRKGFVGHLYTALEKEGIYTYKDDVTLDRGESIGPALSKAIEESHIVIIVFSKNYVNSSWCLDELAHIIECMDKRKQNVLPVFYDVDPSDVRKQNGMYEIAFKKHKSENTNKVESWRKALVEAANLSGWVPSNFANGDEAKCIEDIVDKISGRLFQLVANVNKDFIGIEHRLQDLMSKLDIGSGGVRVVGIWGVGGAGKTTLASAAYMEISHHFEAHCLLQNIRENSENHGLEKLQAKILSCVLKKDVIVWNEIEGRSMIKRRLSNKKVLVVLDDVADLKQLNALAGSHDWFGEGSRIIITTRDEHLLTRHAHMIYEVSLLAHNEATKLFCKHAYKKDKPKEGYENLTQDVVSYAGGLPLALEVLGSFLYDKNEDEWKSALAELKCIPNVEVTKTLKISYDGLQHHRKELFLDIACCMRGWKINKAMMVLDACSFHPRIGVRELIQKSLIKVVDESFEMHDLIEEMARYIVRGEHPNNPEKHSRIWRVDDITACCNMGVDAPIMETEVLLLESYVLDPCEGEPRFMDVVANMKKLRLINWADNSVSSLFPSHFKPTALGCLRLTWSRQNQLWEGCKVNAVEDRFMSVILPTETPVSNFKSASIIKLQLPHNWYSDFSGLLLCFDEGQPYWRTIIIKEDVSMDSQLDNYDNDYWEEFDKNNKESYEYSEMGYVPFGSLRHIPWWNSACTKKISFEIHGKRADFKVGLVPRKSKIGDSRETSNATTINSPKFWDEECEDTKTFEIIYDSRSSNIQINMIFLSLKGIGT